MNTRNILNQEADIVIIDFRYNDVLRLRPRLHIQAARQVDQRNRLATQREQSIDIRMRLRHSRHRRARDDFANLRYIDTIIHMANAELNNLKLIRACLKQDPFFISTRFCCHSIRPHTRIRIIPFYISSMMFLFALKQQIPSAFLKKVHRHHHFSFR